jgi:hypothetical protein
MKRATIIRAIATSMSMMVLMGCSSEDMLSNDSTENKLVPISVTDSGFISEIGTISRTTDSGTSTTFTDGDAIGIYVTDGSGIVSSNLKYTYGVYDGIHRGWTNDTYGRNVPFVPGGKYFAYYPYNESGISNVTATATTAEDFYANLISGWNPSSDQSTHDKYTALDLMVSTGVANSNNNGFTFTLSHQMAMIELDVAQIQYFGDAEKRWKYDLSSFCNIADGIYRMIVRPNTAGRTLSGDINNGAHSLWGSWSIKVASIAGGNYKVYKLSNGEAASLTRSYSEFDIGFLYYSDGTYSQKYDSNKTPIGFIVSTNPDFCEKDQGYGHGLVMALYNATDQSVEIEGHSSYSLHITINGAYGDKSGLSTTKAHSSSSPFYFASAFYEKKVPSPSSSSGWFLPSMGQWWNMAEEIVWKRYFTKLNLYDQKNNDNAVNFIDVNDANNIANYFSSLMSNNGGFTSYKVLDLSTGYWSSTGHRVPPLSISDWYFGPPIGEVDETNNTSNKKYIRSFLAF